MSIDIEKMPWFLQVSRVKGFQEGIVSHVLSGDPLNGHSVYRDKYTRSDISEKLSDMSHCGTLLELREYETGVTRVHNGNYCGNPVVCPVCADRVSNRRRAIYRNPIEAAASRFAFSYLVTFTIKDGPDLQERIDHLAESMKRFRLQGQRRGNKKSGGQWSVVSAGISSVEIKKGRNSGSWHVHAHCLLFTNERFKNGVSDRTIPHTINAGTEKEKTFMIDRIQSEWLTASHGDSFIVRADEIEYKPIVGRKKVKTKEESVFRQSLEVLKYPLVLSGKKGIRSLSPADFEECIQRRGNRRLFNTYGKFRSNAENSLMGLPEIERQRQEYVDSMAGSYRIYSTQWRDGHYMAPVQEGKAIFKNSDPPLLRRRLFLQICGVIQGEYRRARREVLKGAPWSPGDKPAEIENLLDSLKRQFRKQVSAIWSRLLDPDFSPTAYIFQFQAI